VVIQGLAKTSSALLIKDYADFPFSGIKHLRRLIIFMGVDY